MVGFGMFFSFFVSDPQNQLPRIAVVKDGDGH